MHSIDKETDLKNIRLWFSVCFLLFTLIFQPSSLSQIPQIINYQGRLLNGTNLVNGTVGLSLRLYSQPVGGSVLYVDSNSVTVVDGLYSTLIGDHPTNNAFLVALDNSAVWVEVVVNGTTLAPRERLASVGYSLATRGLFAATNGSIVLNPFLGQNAIVASSESATIAGGRENIIDKDSSFAAIGGGADNVVEANNFSATIAGGGANDIGTNAGYSAIGGGLDNNVAANSSYATITGGGANDIGTNSDYSAIGGGENNNVAANSQHGTIAGGENNDVGTSSGWSAIAGGFNNNVAANSEFATIAGGYINDIGTNSDYSVIGGGGDNNVAANSSYATIPGGWLNEVGPGATNAFAAGRRAKANHRGAFVWGDDTNADMVSTTNNQVTFRAGGGFRVLNGELQAGGGLQVGLTGTSLDLFQAGTAVLGTGINVTVYSVSFSNAFATVPRVVVTTRNDPLFNVNDTFVATVRAVTTTNFTINVVRVDAAAGWAQQLRADWLAWE